MKVKPQLYKQAAMTRKVAITSEGGNGEAEGGHDNNPRAKEKRVASPLFPRINDRNASCLIGSRIA